jgi:hypothetical protein
MSFWNWLKPFVEVIEVDREIGLDAHRFCRQYSSNKLLPNDAIHLACALRASCDVLLAWDTPLTTVSHPGIRIEEPSIYDRGLFTDNEVATGAEITEYEARISSERDKREAAARALVREQRHIIADKLSDTIVALHKDGKLPTPFTTRQVRNLLGSQYEDPLINEILHGYCADGVQVKRGRGARFKRVSRGQYVSI